MVVAVVGVVVAVVGVVVDVVGAVVVVVVEIEGAVDDDREVAIDEEGDDIEPVAVEPFEHPVATRSITAKVVTTEGARSRTRLARMMDAVWSIDRAVPRIGVGVGSPTSPSGNAAATRSSRALPLRP